MMSSTGGQASLRQMSINLKIYSHLNTLQLVALTSTSWRFDSGTSWDAYKAIVNGLFISALVGSVTTESFPRHFWVSSWFPLIGKYEIGSEEVDQEGWFTKSYDPYSMSEVYAFLVDIVYWCRLRPIHQLQCHYG